MLFQSTPPHGRRRVIFTIALLHLIKFQSTPPHGRRPLTTAKQSTATMVSIHASAREATRRRGYGRRRRGRFNPRLRTGGDARYLPYLAPSCVSIHASAREATIWPANLPMNLFCFNPRLRTGGDVPWLTARPVPSKFQSTPPHGRRRPEAWRSLPGWPVSIHASAREATAVCHPHLLREGCFNPRLRTGGDLSFVVHCFSRYGFNPRLRTGGDLNECFYIEGQASFNPRLRTGGDHQSLRCSAFHILFQSTPPHGRRQSRNFSRR